MSRALTSVFRVLRRVGLSAIVPVGPLLRDAFDSEERISPWRARAVLLASAARSRLVLRRDDFKLGHDEARPAAASRHLLHFRRLAARALALKLANNERTSLRRFSSPP